MSLLVPKKDGGPNVEFFQSPESIQGFEQIRQWLHKTNKKVSIRRVSRHCVVHIYENSYSIPAILKSKQNTRMKLCQNHNMHEPFPQNVYIFTRNIE